MVRTKRHTGGFVATRAGKTLADCDGVLIEVVVTREADCDGVLIEVVVTRQADGTKCRHVYAGRGWYRDGIFSLADLAGATWNIV